MSTSTPVRAMDTLACDEISVSINRRSVILADTTQIPYHRIYLTVAEARKLAEFLTEQATEAEAFDA